jgi:hypothetical protein
MINAGIGLLGILTLVERVALTPTTQPYYLILIE